MTHKIPDQLDNWTRGLALFSEMFGDARASRWANRNDRSGKRLAQFLVENVYGNVWSDTTLSRRERSLVTVAVLAALGKQEELAVHFRAASRNGCEIDSLHEIMMQVSIYAGFPAGLTGDRILRATQLAEKEKPGDNTD